MKYKMVDKFGAEATVEFPNDIANAVASVWFEKDGSLTALDNRSKTIVQLTPGEDWKWKAGE